MGVHVSVGWGEVSGVRLTHDPWQVCLACRWCILGIPPWPTPLIFLQALGTWSQQHTQDWQVLLT